MLALLSQRRIDGRDGARVQLRAALVREMRGDGGRACGRKAGRARPERSVSRHAARSAASSCHRAVSIWNMPMALKRERKIVQFRKKSPLQVTSKIVLPVCGKSEHLNEISDISYEIMYFAKKLVRILKFVMS